MESRTDRQRYTIIKAYIPFCTTTDNGINAVTSSGRDVNSIAGCSERAADIGCDYRRSNQHHKDMELTEGKTGGHDRGP